MDNKEIMYDHYKDTYKIQNNNEKTRNKLFLVLCFAILVLMMMIIYPDNVYENIQEIFLKKLGINIKFELSLLDVFNWFIIKIGKSWY